MERFDADIGSVDTALEQAPEVFQAVCVNSSANVFNRMVNHMVSIVGFQSVIGEQRIGVQRSTGLHVRSDLSLQSFLLPVRNDLCLHTAMIAVFRPFQHTKYGCLIFWACSGNTSFANVDMHVAGLPANETLVNFTLTAQLENGTML